MSDTPAKELTRWISATGEMPAMKADPTGDWVLYADLLPMLRKAVMAGVRRGRKDGTSMTKKELAAIVEGLSRDGL